MHKETPLPHTSHPPLHGKSCTASWSRTRRRRKKGLLLLFVPWVQFFLPIQWPLLSCCCLPTYSPIPDGLSRPSLPRHQPLLVSAPTLATAPHGAHSSPPLDSACPDRRRAKAPAQCHSSRRRVAGFCGGLPRAAPAALQ